jgi:DNA-binding NtrC family response regulator
MRELEKGKEQTRLRKTASILLADDEPSILYTFRAILEQEGYEVLPAPTLEQARQAIRERELDAIVAALSLEEEGLGLELAREAKNLSSPPAVVVYSGNPSVDKLRAAMSAQVDYFAFQPIDLEEIKSDLFRLIALRSDRSSLD